MKEYDQFEDFHKLLDLYNFFTPILAYNDDFYINLVTQYPLQKQRKEFDILYLNSREEKGKNLFEEFCKKYFFKGINQRMSIRGNFFPLIKMYLKEDGTRGIAFDYYETCLAMVNGNQEYVTRMKNDNPESVLDVTKEYLHKIRSMTNDVIKKGEKSEFYSIIEEICTDNNIPVNEASLNKVFDYYTDLIMSVNHMRANLKEGLEINIEEFKRCFDIDKLYLIIAKSIVDANRPVVEKYHEITPAYGEVITLIQTAKDNDMIGKYNPNIKFINPETLKEEKYSFKDLLAANKEFEEKADFSSIKPITDDDIAKMGLGKYENVKKYHELINTTPEGEILTNWDIIRPGEKESTIENNSREKNDREPQTNRKDLSSNDIIYRRFIFEKIPYKCQIVGNEKFAGYVGYVYPNGLVAFEKFYEDIKMTPVKYGNATYIMNIQNFTKFSRLDKQQIMDYIKSTDNPDIIRLYHSKNWEQKLIHTINGVAYTEEAKMLIDSIIEQQKIDKKEI